MSSVAMPLLPHRAALNTNSCACSRANAALCGGCRQGGGSSSDGLEAASVPFLVDGSWHRIFYAMPKNTEECKEAQPAVARHHLPVGIAGQRAVMMDCRSTAHL